MLDSHARTLYQKVCVDPIINQLVKTRFSPTAITLIGALIGVLILPLTATNHTYLAFIALLATGYLDTLDGSLARWKKEDSPLGATLDIFCDRLVESAILLGFYFAAPETRALPTILMFASILLCITAFLVVGIFSDSQGKKSFFYSPGLMERTEAFIFFALMLLLPQHYIGLAYTFAALVTLSALLHIVRFRRWLIVVRQ